MNRLILPALAAVLALPAACGGEKKPAAGNPDEAAGQILERSVSDDMLPFDTTRSQPPLAAPDASDAVMDDIAEADVAPTPRSTVPPAASTDPGELAAKETPAVRPTAE